jgi:hypothetical protein
MRIPASLFLLLAACNREEKPEAPTAAEAQRLNEAEAMLNGLANEGVSTSEPITPQPAKNQP